MEREKTAKRTPKQCKPQRRAVQTVVGNIVEDLTLKCKKGLPNGLDLRARQRGQHTATGGVRNPMHYDGSAPDVVHRKLFRRRGERRFFRFGTWNIGSMTGKGGELASRLKKRGVGMCFLQETKWKGEDKKWFGDYRFYYKGQDRKKKNEEKCSANKNAEQEMKKKEKGKKRTPAEAGVGVMIEKELVERVIEVVAVNERIIIVKLQWNDRILHAISAYAPQKGRGDKCKEEFWNQLHEEVRKIPKEDKIWMGADLNGHIGKERVGYENVHGGIGFGVRDKEGVSILDFAETHNLTISNTWFKRKEDRLVTYSSGEGKSLIDYIIVRAEDRKGIENTKVIAGEEVVRQHKLVVCDISYKMDKKVKTNWRSKTKIWKLKDDENRKEYKDKLKLVNTKECRTVNDKWTETRDAMIKAADEVCGRTKGPPRHQETWWWKEEVDKIVEEKRTRYLQWMNAKKRGDGSQDKLHKEYKAAKKRARQVVRREKQEGNSKFAEGVNTAAGKENICKIAKQMVKKNKDKIGGKCLRDDEGNLVTGDENLKKQWKKYMEKLLNEENEWDGNVEAENIEGPIREISYEEVEKAVRKMKLGKAAGPSGVMADHLKAGGEVVIEQLTDICNQIMIEGGIPDDWRRSTMTTLYKGKGDPLSCSAYRGIKLLELGLKVFDRIMDRRIRNRVTINESQFGFMPGRGTVDAIFIVRQLQEKYLGKNRKLYLGFVDLEKAFDRVPREVVKWALRKEGVEEWLIKTVMYTYVGARTAVRVGNGFSEDFEVKVGVHQGAVLSPLLFIIVMQAITKHVATGLPWELLYADDLVVTAESEDELKMKMRNWKEAMEMKGLKVNVGKTKVMCSQHGRGPVRKSDIDPCGVCGGTVKETRFHYTLACKKCKQWVHNKCREGRKDFRNYTKKEKDTFTCKKCKFTEKEGSGFVDGEKMVMNKVESFETVEKFCYLGDMLSSGGGADTAISTRISCGWMKFWELAPILTNKEVRYYVKKKLYLGCVRPIIMYAAETWEMTNAMMERLRRVEMRMVRWMCGVTLLDRKPSEELKQRLGLDKDIAESIRESRLRWFGHVMRKKEDDGVKKCMNMTVEGTKIKGRRTTWLKTVQGDMKLKDLKEEDAMNRVKWRAGIKKKLQG